MTHLTLLIEAPRILQSTMQSIKASISDTIRVESSALYHKMTNFSPIQESNNLTFGSCLLLTLESSSSISLGVGQLMSRLKNVVAQHNDVSLSSLKIWSLTAPELARRDDGLSEKLIAPKMFPSHQSAPLPNSKAAGAKSIDKQDKSCSRLHSKTQEKDLNISSASEEEEIKMEKLKKLLSPQKFQFAVRPKKKRSRISQIFTQGFKEFNDKLKERHMFDNLKFVEKSPEYKINRR